MDIFELSEKFVEVILIRHKFELIVNAINDQERKCLTKDEELLFKKSLQLINCQAEAMCKILKIEVCKSQQCLQKLSRKRLNSHLAQRDENAKKARSVKKEISKGGPKIDHQTRSIRKSLSNLSKKTLNKQTNRNVVHQHPENRKEFIADSKSNILGLLREKLKKVNQGGGHPSRKYSNDDLKQFRDYVLNMPNADDALDYFGISLQHFSHVCSSIGKFVDSGFRNPTTKKQKEEENIYNCYIENGIQATVKRYGVTKKRVYQINHKKSLNASTKVNRLLKRLKRPGQINSTKSGNDYVKKKQPSNSSMIKKEEKKVIFEIFISFDRMNYPLNVTTVPMIVKHVKRHFDQTDPTDPTDRTVIYHTCTYIQLEL